MITCTQFRIDYPEFADRNRFTDNTLKYWLYVAYLLINQNRFGAPAPFIAVSGVPAAPGAGYVVDDLVTVAGGTNTQPAILEVTGVNGTGGITAFAVSNQGQYTLPPSNPAAQQSTTGAGAGATFTLTFQSGPYTEHDIAVELFTAHNLVLEARAAQEASTGALPGAATGPVSAKSVNGVSISYDIAVAAVEGMGDMNLTTYGTRLARLIKLFGMGPVQINPRGGCGWWGGPAFQGPIYALGIGWDN